MSLLFFDTETTGLPSYALPLDHEEQPHIVQLAALLTDFAGEQQGCFCALIRPDRWTIEEGAQEVHGISTEQCQRYGVPVQVALEVLNGMVEQSTVVIAHNIDFDRRMVEIETVRAKINHEIEHRPPNRSLFCTMKAATPVLKLPGRFGSYKWPKLIETYRHFFNEDFEGAHDALADVRACAKCYFKLKNPQTQEVQP